MTAKKGKNNIIHCLDFVNDQRERLKPKMNELHKKVCQSHKVGIGLRLNPNK